jgi:hypothetical protein
VRHKTQDSRPTNFRIFEFSNFRIFALLILLGMSSCFKEKTIAPPTNNGQNQTAVIEMGQQYTNQFFYSLATNTVVAQNSRFAYDLMFDCNAANFNIWLNTAKQMRVKRMNQTDLDSVTLNDTIGGIWHYELGEFNPDSNAIGKWWDGGTSTEPASAGKVYLIQLGIDDDGNSLGYIKLKVNDFTSSNYSITYSDFISADKTFYVAKDDTRNYRYFVAAGNGSLLNNIEPPKTDWDLCFTRYTIFFYDPYNIPYQVTGVLNNPSRTTAYLDADTTLLFDTVTINKFDVNKLLTRRDAIGYEWKRYGSFTDDDDYVINQHYTYYAKVDDDKFYKLRFFSFSRNGIRGYPSFEYFLF